MVRDQNVPNRLENEVSPYLKQHARNPVDWYPWGDEAFEKARREDKPVFLSVGYSTCHWCHVMAHESFEDKETAELLNREFVAVKVDKEERPDVDAIYMKVCQGMTGSGGWPLTVIMDWRQRPFFAGTYFPRVRRFQTPGLTEVLKDTVSVWKESRVRIEEIQKKVLHWLSLQGSGSLTLVKEKSEEEAESRKLIQQAVRELLESFDEKNGGFYGQPKFPSPQNLMFLMRFFDAEQENAEQELAERAKQMAEMTLRQMYRGGIFDHLGGGFSRYSTDVRWLAPHFEKMLYDNSLLAIGYVEAAKLFSSDQYTEIAHRTLRYLLREMRSEEGGFYSAQDADSEGEEGKFYVFTPAEIKRVLGEERGTTFCSRYDVTQRGNFEGKNILNLLADKGYKQEASAGIEPEQWQQMRERLYDYRKQRYSLHRDEKALTAWNSMAVIAFAKAGRLLHDGEHYRRIAEEAMRFIRDKLKTEDGSLYISRGSGVSSGQGTLDEYAYYGWALLELYESTLMDAYIREAVAVASLLEERFWDKEHGGFYLTDREGEALIYRPKEVYDGAMPSGNSTAGYFLVKLATMTGEEPVKRLAEKQLRFLRAAAKEYPQGHCFAMMALLMDCRGNSFLCENGVC